MRPLSPSELLDAWERGVNEPPATRMLSVLAAAGAAVSADAVAALSVGERDRRLFDLREWTFGPQLLSVAACPACRERLEWAIDARALRGRAEPAATADLSLESRGYIVRFRLPNTIDLAAAADAGSVPAARGVILGRCLVEVHRDGEPVGAADVPIDVTDAIATAMAEADRSSSADIELTCPACGHHWTLLFDIESFFWSELSAWAPRILKDVHTLARAYGWREADILQMGQWRRQFYLTQIGA
jgi:uncharacterized protein YbaR (Trm112 family)